MAFEVIYYPMCAKNICEGVGSVARVIAAELGITAEETANRKVLANGSCLFLGASCFAVRIWGELLAFIKGNNFHNRPVALFGVSESGNDAIIQAIRIMLEPTGAMIMGSFHCQGTTPQSWNSHPDEAELTYAREFARNIKDLLK